MSEQVPSKRALLIGNDHYTDAGLAHLVSPKADVQRLHDVLQSPEVGGFDAVHILFNEPRQIVEERISSLFLGRLRDDLVLLYFSGHGVLDPRGSLFLALNDTRVSNLLGTGVAARFIQQAMDGSASRRQVLILDCCYAGAFERAGKGSGIGTTILAQDNFDPQGYGRFILTSSTATQYSLDGDDVRGEAEVSLFTRHLIQGLETGEAAPGCDEITVDQLYEYSYDQVLAATSKMTPGICKKSGQGALVIARNPNPHPDRAIIPEALADLLEETDYLVREGAVRTLAAWLGSEDEAEARAASVKLGALRDSEHDRRVLKVIDEVLPAGTGDRHRAPVQSPALPPGQSAGEPASGSQTGLAVSLVANVLLLVAALIYFRFAEQGPIAPLTTQVTERLEAENAELEEARDRQAQSFADLKGKHAALQGQVALIRQKLEREVEAYRATQVQLDDVSRPLVPQPGCAVCPEMVVIPAGVFTMGSPATEKEGSADEGPTHGVAVGRFEVGKTEVTFEQWDACVLDQACSHKPADEGWGRGDRPVINISWDDTKEYMGWLSDKTGEAYRLPSEAEWEYAARAGTSTPFHFGQTITTDQSNYNGNHAYAGGSKGEYRQKTVPVGSFSANVFGLHEVHGNVWEWVEDVWHESYEGAPVDGEAWTSEGESARVLRGGSWYSFARNTRSAHRIRSDPDLRNLDVGFRVARTLP